jgi:HK97 family phage major capsid protein
MKALFSGDREALKFVGGTSDGAGAYLIPEELRSEILRIAQNQYGLARRDMRYLPFSGPGNERKIPALATSVSVSWTGEGQAKRSTQPTFDVVTQTLKKLAAIVPMTEEIIEDSTINLTALVAELFAEAVAKEEDLQFFAGTGAPWTGILNNGLVNVVNTATDDPADITADDLLALVDATPTSVIDGAKFYMNRTVYSKIRTLREGVGTGTYIVQPPTAGGPASMWGYPVELSDAFTPVSTTGQDVPFVLFGNLKKTAIFGDKQQLRVKMLDQATVNNTTNNGTLNLAQQDMIALRIVERVGYVLALPTGVSVLKTVSAGS